jgi:hypothetical protein
MVPRNAYKDMLDNVVSLITCVSMNHQNQLEQMTNEAILAIAPGWERCGWGSLEMFLEFKAWGSQQKCPFYEKKIKFECSKCCDCGTERLSVSVFLWEFECSKCCDCGTERLSVSVWRCSKSLNALNASEAFLQIMLFYGKKLYVLRQKLKQRPWLSSIFICTC